MDDSEANKAGTSEFFLHSCTHHHHSTSRDGAAAASKTYKCQRVGRDKLILSNGGPDSSAKKVTTPARRRQYDRSPAAALLLPLLLVFAHEVQLSHQQSTISLDSAQWFVSNSNGSLVLPASVPGGIYSDLRRNQVLRQELLFGKNDVAYRWVGQENWTYTTSFAIDQQIAMSQSVRLVLHGVDTVATVLLNGEEVGQTDNMFVRYKFEVKSQLKLAGLKNVLTVRFESPIKYAARQSNASIRQNRGKVIPPYCPSPAQRGECHVNFVRKMQASFSWDWGPAFPSMGLYKSVDLEYGSFGLIRDILVETRRLAPLESGSRLQAQAAGQVIISSTIRHNVRTPTNEKSVPYMRAPPYYVASADDSDRALLVEAPQRTNRTQSLAEENWLLKITLVAEMVQASFPYNIRVEFNLNEVLHYESEHISVVANPEGFIRLGFNLRIDSSRMRVKPWWPNNAGGQHLYKLAARIMPIPAASPPDRLRIQPSEPMSAAANERHMSLQARSRPLQTPALAPPLIFLATSAEAAGPANHTSEKEIWFGFRTVELVQEPVTRGQLEDGLTFNFRVNGVDLFAMGSNWIPASVLPENSHDLDYIRYLLQSAKDANMNMLRVWGGGIYESDEFYRLADELGIMIWHDLMFACALYPVDDAFLASVRLEVEQQVQRLQHHPSIVLWAGNNENEMAIAGPWWPEVMVWNKKMRENYAKLYHETIRPIVTILDPTRPYVESSPSNGIMSQSRQFTISRQPNDNKFGDVHHYDYLADSFDWTVYPSTRFASEYGFQSYPSFNALTSIVPPADWKYPLTSNILHRQHRGTGESEMKLQMKVHFSETKSGGADKLKNFVYVSQLTQAIAIKTETEFYRRNRFIDPDTKLGRTMGALYWQLNDVWQAPTWSSIEYGGKWKVLHYFARRFFFPIQLMPYLLQPSSVGAMSNSVQQAASGGSMLSNLAQRLPGGALLMNQLSSSDYGQPATQQASAGQQQPSGGPLFVVDLVRDDLFDLLDSFNVTVRFYRWTSFAPVWQDSVYVHNTRPQNVTRIYEQEVARIVRQPGVVSLSSGVFQVSIEQQPRLGLSQIENYLMPVAPNKVTAMRVAKINVELIQGPFELTENRRARRRASSGRPRNSLLSEPLWACAYRLTLVSDSIAMFVWLDLNLLNSGPGGEAQRPPPNTQRGFQNETFDEGSQGLSPLGENIHLDALHSHANPSMSSAGGPRPAAHMPPDHIRLHMNQQQSRPRPGSPAREMFEPAAGDRSDQVPDNHMAADSAYLHSQGGDALGVHDESFAGYRPRRHVRSRQAPDRIFLDVDNDGAGGHPDDQPGQINMRNQYSASRPRPTFDKEQPRAPRQPARRRFVPVDASGGNMLRYQFSDNAFNMFEPSRVIDLYLSRCLGRAQVEYALEVQSLADNL